MKTNVKIWFIVLLLACLNESSHAQSNIWINGKLLTNQKEGDIGIYNDMLLFGTPELIAKTHVNSYGNFNFDFNITKSRAIRLFNRTFYIIPGDSIIMNITGDRYSPEKIEFTGRNANHYIYSMKYDSITKILPFKFYRYNSANSLTKYLDSANMNKNILINQLNNFSKSHKLSSEFKSYALSRIVYDYYYQLLIPITTKKYSIEQIPSSYSLILDHIKLSDDKQVDKSEYVAAARNLVKYKKLKTNKNELKLINENFTGLTKEFLLTTYAGNLISDYISKDSLVTRELFKKIDSEIKNPEFRKHFKTINDQLKCLSPFPKEVLLTSLTDSIGNKLTFKDLLAKSKNKIIILDFWASWCGACIANMPEVNKLKPKFNSSDVEFVFISLDDSMKDWKGGMEKTKLPGKHYWINDNYKSALVKFLVIPAIPRYVIINKGGTIEKLNSFGPSKGDNGLQTEITKLLIH